MRPSVDRRPVALRCNAPRPAQKTPHAPDTPWGRLRAPLGWSLRDLSERTGIHIAALSRIERRIEGPTPDQARALLRVFDNTGAVG
jgi:hypothetical protein